MGAFFCRHHPACPVGISRWNCQQRTIVEGGMGRGVLTEREGQRLLTLYGVPRTPASRVVTGQRRPEEKLW